MYVSPETRAMILEDMAKPFPDLRRISTAYGIPIAIIRSLEEQPKSSEFSEKYGGLGRPELRPYIISRRLVTTYWPAADRVIFEKHHQLYDLGFVEMCQGRDGDWIIQYSIPRLIPAMDRTPYFSRDFGYE